MNLRHALAALAVLSSVAGVHCTVSIDQCASDSDCDRILGTTAGAAVCRAGTCARSNAPVSGGDGGAEAPCSTNDDCTLRNNGAPSICRTPGEASCVQLTSDVCATVSPNWRDTKPGKTPLVVGVLFPEEVQGAGGAMTKSSFDTANLGGLDLALEEWHARTEGGLLVEGVRQPVLRVHCDTKITGERAIAAYRHLRSAGAQVIVARARADVFSILPESVPDKKLVVCSDCVGGSIPAQDAAGLVWYLQPSLTAYGKVSAAAVSNLETMLRQRNQVLDDNGTFRVAMVASGDVVLQRFADETEAALVINGAPASGQASSAFLRINTPDERVTQPDYADVVARLLAFKPDVLVTNVAGSFTFRYFTPIEAGWPAGAKHKPYWVAGNDETNGLLDPNIFSKAGTRMLGVRVSTPPSVQPVYEKYRQGYLARYGQDPGNVVSGYDAFYVAGNLLAATLTRATVVPSTMTGLDLAQSFARLRPVAGSTSQSVSHEPAQIAAGVQALREGQSIDLRGVSSELDWNLTNGTVSRSTQIECLAGKLPQPSEYKFAGIRTLDDVSVDGTLDLAGCGF